MVNVKRMVNEISEKYNFNSPRVFSAMMVVPREKFTPRKYRYLAYKDNPIPIGYGQTMSQPYTVAFMTGLVIADRKVIGKKVLEIGTGSGYQAAVLSRLFKDVYTVEIIDDLAKRAQRMLGRLGYKNVHVRCGSGEWGWPEASPFDAIIITAAVEKKVPKELFLQLKTNGVLVAPIGPRNLQTMTKFTKRKDSLKKEEFQKYVFVPFVEKGN